MKRIKKQQLDQLIKLAQKHQALKLPVLLFLLCGIAVCTVDEKCGQAKGKKQSAEQSDAVAVDMPEMAAERVMSAVEIAIAQSDAKARAAALQIMLNLANQVGEYYEKEEEQRLPDFCQEPEDEDAQAAVVATKILALVLNQTKEEIRARVSILTRAPSPIWRKRTNYILRIDDG